MKKNSPAQVPSNNKAGKKLSLRQGAANRAPGIGQVLLVSLSSRMKGFVPPLIAGGRLYGVSFFKKKSPPAS